MSHKKFNESAFIIGELRLVEWQAPDQLVGPPLFKKVGMHHGEIAFLDEMKDDKVMLEKQNGTFFGYTDLDNIRPLNPWKMQVSPDGTQ